MFWDKIFQFMKGYVILFLSGISMERFLNLCLKQNISLLRSEKVSGGVRLTIYARDFLQLRPIARITRTKIRILKKQGFPFLCKRHRYRRAFAGGAILFVLFLAVSSCFLWSVEVRGAKREHQAEILSAAKEAGVYKGAFIHNLPSGNEMKHIILSKTEHITWAWVYRKGTKAIIEVREKTMPPAVVNPDAACDVIALRDAMVQKIIVKDGIGVVSAGDVVLSGDVLIAGTLTAPEGGYRLRHAQGEVYASTWYTAGRIVPRHKTVQTLTGAKKSFFELVFFSKTVPLYHALSVPFSDFRLTEDFFSLGSDNIGVRRLCYEEAQTQKEPLPDESVAAFTKDLLEEEIAQKLLNGAVKKKEAFHFRVLDEEHLEVNLTIEFLEQIGQERPLLLPEKQE